MLAAEEAIGAGRPYPVGAGLEDLQVVPAQLGAGQAVVAGQRAGDGLDAGVPDPEGVVDGRPGVNFPVVSEDQQVGPARPELRPQVLYDGRQCRLHAGAVQLLVPEVEVGFLEGGTGLRGQVREVARVPEVVHRQPEVEPELAAGHVEGPQERRTAQAGQWIGDLRRPVERLARGQVRERAGEQILVHVVDAVRIPVQPE